MVDYQNENSDLLKMQQYMGFLSYKVKNKDICIYAQQKGQVLVVFFFGVYSV